jgi:hypothetical protein
LVATVDDEHLLRRHNGDDRRGGHTPDPPSRPHLEQRRIVRVEVREDPLDRAAPAAGQREPDAAGEPVASDRLDASNRGL